MTKSTNILNGVRYLKQVGINAVVWCPNQPYYFNASINVGNREMLMGLITLRNGTVFSRRSADIDGAKIVLHELTELDADPQISPIMDNRYDVIERRRGQGHEIFGYEENGIIVAYFWVTRAGNYVPIVFNSKFMVPPKSIYIWDCRTHETHRNKGIFAAGVRSLSTMQWAENILIAANSDNNASNKAIKNVGFRERFMSYYGISFPAIPKIGLPIFPTITWKRYYR
jgi:hypothetical protein